MMEATNEVTKWKSHHDIGSGISEQFYIGLRHRGVIMPLVFIVGDGTDQQASNYERYCPEAPVCRPSGYSSIKRGVA